MAYTDINVNDLIINKLTKAQFDELNASGSLSDTELYYITDEDRYLKSDNLKTINGQSLIGTGDITISGGSGSGAGIDDSSVATNTTYSSSKIITELGKKQDTLTSGTNIKTINGASILGGGNIQIDMPTDYYTKEESYSKQEIDNKLSSAYRYIGSVATYDNLPTENLSQGNVYNVEDTGMNYAWTGTKWDALGATFDLSGKQDKLVSGTNIKTINGQDILGSGNLEIGISNNNPVFHSSLTLDNNVASGEAYRLVVYGATADGVQFNLQKYNATDNSFIENTSYMRLKSDGIYFNDSKISGGGSVSGDYLPLSGGTLTGPLVVQGSKESGISVKDDEISYRLDILVNKIQFTDANDGQGPREVDFMIDPQYQGTVATVPYVSAAVNDILNQKFVVSSTEPANPQEGMVWIQISE